MPSLPKKEPTHSLPAPHIGEFVRQAMEQQQVSQAELARRMNMSQTALTLILRKPTFQVALLWNISQALQHNFFAELGQSFPTDPTQKVATELELALQQQLTALQQQLAAAQQQLTDQQKETAVYEKVLGMIGRNN